MDGALQRLYRNLSRPDQELVDAIIVRLADKNAETKRVKKQFVEQLRLAEKLDHQLQDERAKG